MNAESETHKEFKRKLKEEWKQKAVCGRHYVLINDLKKWMNEKNGVANNCAELLRAEYQDHSRSYQQPLQASQVCSDTEGCCLVFGILLDIGRGNLLDLFHAAKIFDDHLPSADYYYNDLKEQLAKASFSVADISKIVSDFHCSKRAYCLAELKPRSDSFHHGKWILPISRKERINTKGGTAAIWQISVKSEVLPKELKDKVPHAEINDEDFGWCYQFALKEYSLENEDSYRWEKQAFQLFVGLEGMIQYLGDFTYEDEQDSQKRSFNILLEFGELDLDEYFAGIRPPRLAVEIHQFWSDLFEVAKALKEFHNVRLQYDDGRDQHISGLLRLVGYDETDYEPRYYAVLWWHADVKPDNILSVRGSFLLADFGFARFQKKSTQSHDEPALETLTGGTDTYGAPETDAIRRGEAALTTVLQTIDIWSFGCVLSMAATWVVLGFQGIRDYGAVRRKATAILRENDKPGPVASDAFHNGINVLDEVLIWHAYLRKSIRRHDVTTEPVLTLVEEHMLLKDPRERINSAMLCSELAKIVEKSKCNVNAKADPTQANFNNLLANIDAYVPSLDVTSQTLPSHDAVKLASGNSLFVLSESSRDSIRTGSPSAKQVKKSRRINAIPRLKTTIRTTRRLGVPSQNIDATLKPTKRPGSISAGPNPTLYVTEAPDLSPIAVEKSLEEESQSPLLKASSPKSMVEPVITARSDLDKKSTLDSFLHTPKEQRTSSEDIGTPNVGPIRPFPSPLQTLDSSKVDYDTTTQSSSRPSSIFGLHPRQAVNGKILPDSSETSTLLNRISTTVSQDIDGTRLDPMLSGTNQVFEGRISTDHGSLHSHGRPVSAYSSASNHGLHSTRWIDPDLNIYRVRQELDVKIERKSHKLLDKLGFAKVDPLLRNYITNRDIAFIVDNGTTMVQHWPYVQFTLETLYLKLDGLDKNGVDLVFTDRAKSNNNKEQLMRLSGFNALVRSMNEARPIESNDLDDRVRTNMREVLGPIFQKFLANGPDKRMTLIILTDGVWEGSNQEEGEAQKIAEFYKNWQAKWGVVEDRWFSIQFVSFGNDQAALDRLQVLDDELGKSHKIPDFVDTEPWTGTVKKMITGSLSDEDDAGGGERSPPPNTPTSPTYLNRNGTTKASSRFSIPAMFGKKAHVSPSTDH